VTSFPFGRGVRYDDLFELLIGQDCSIQEWVRAGEITNPDGSPCPSMYRLSRVVQGEMREYPLTRYPDDEWCLLSVVLAIEAALDVDLVPPL
jgi:hypothetical protein